MIKYFHSTYYKIFIGTTHSDQNRPTSNGKKEVLHIPQSYRTGA